MRRIVTGPLAAALMALWAIPAPAWASARAGASSADVYGPEGEGEDDLVIIDEGEIEGEEPAGEEAPAAEGDVDIDIFGEEEEAPDVGAVAPPPGSEVGKQEKDSAEKQIKTESRLIRVIQRQRMLKKGRIEVQPQFGITVNDPYVRHYTIGADVNYWFHNRMAIGAQFIGFIGAKTPRYDNIRFQNGLLLTANEILWQGGLSFYGNPFYGKIAIFNRALLHWEGSLMVGADVMQTRVIPRFESLHDPFTNITGGGHIGLLGKFYVPKVDWLSINFGTKFTIFADRLEPPGRGPDTGPMGTDDIALDPADAAKDAANLEIAYNVLFFLGVSFYFPTSFEYTTPR